LPHYLGLEAPRQPGYPLPSAKIWEGVIADPESMVQRFHEDRVQIPETMIRIIATAFSGDNAGRDAAVVEIAAAMARPYTGVDMRREIQRQKSTSPGLSRFTYEMLKMLPGEGLDDLFKIMNRLWLAKHVPKFWTLKGSSDCLRKT
jgi:hypothetical protein